MECVLTNVEMAQAKTIEKMAKLVHINHEKW